MYRVVRAERWRTERGDPLFGLGFPQVLTPIQVPVFAYDLYAAYRRRPLRTALSTAATMGLKSGSSTNR